MKVLLLEGVPDRILPFVIASTSSGLSPTIPSTPCLPVLCRGSAPFYSFPYGWQGLIMAIQFADELNERRNPTGATPCVGIRIFQVAQSPIIRHTIYFRF